MGPNINVVNFHARIVGTKSPPKIQPGKDSTQLAIKWHAVWLVQDGGRQDILKQRSVSVTPISLTWRTKLRKGWKPEYVSFQRDKLPQKITSSNLSVWEAAFLGSDWISAGRHKTCNLEKTKDNLASSLSKVFNPYIKLHAQRRPDIKKKIATWCIFC